MLPHYATAHVSAKETQLASLAACAKSLRDALCTSAQSFLHFCRAGSGTGGPAVLPVLPAGGSGGPERYPLTLLLWHRGLALCAPQHVSKACGLSGCIPAW
eukprot:567709-Pelagomonas_calceolata.AAC.3